VEQNFFLEVTAGFMSRHCRWASHIGLTILSLNDFLSLKWFYSHVGLFK